MVAASPPLERRRPFERIAGQPVDVPAVRRKPRRRQRETERRAQAILRRRLRALPHYPREARKHDERRRPRRDGQRSADAAEDPPSRSEQVEREDREQHERRLAIGDAEEERERKDRREEHG